MVSKCLHNKHKPRKHQQLLLHRHSQRLDRRLTQVVGAAARRQDHADDTLQ